MAATKQITDNFKARKKYNRLKAYNFEDMTPEQMVYFRKMHKISVAEAEQFIKTYEENNKPDPEQQKKVVEYFQNLYNPKPKEKKAMTKGWLYKRFKKSFYQNEGVLFQETPESIENIKPLIFYFIGDFDNFKKCKNICKISEPSMKKGLLLIGHYGNGKTSAMMALKHALKQTNVFFREYTTKEVVKMYESAEEAGDKKHFDKTMLTGTIYFDDALTEKEASRYGKHELFTDILEERYSKKSRTYLSINHKQGTTNVEQAFKQIGERYGGRLHDRAYDMFNIIEFTGKSFRK